MCPYNPLSKMHGLRGFSHRKPKFKRYIFSDYFFSRCYEASITKGLHIYISCALWMNTYAMKEADKNETVRPQLCQSLSENDQKPSQKSIQVKKKKNILQKLQTNYKTMNLRKINPNFKNHPNSNISTQNKTP